jgi:hypothetical protein
MRDVQPNGQHVLIDDDVDLGAQPATTTADGVILPRPFPPAACWWARTMELSINAATVASAVPVPQPLSARYPTWPTG